MSSELCRIIFDNPHNTYFAGETISGRVEIALQNPKEIKGIRIEIKGAAYVRWSEGRDTTYSAEEEYFRSKDYLVRDENQDTFTLPAGNHVYRFLCPLPSTLPTSLEGEYGRIRYEAEVIIERPRIWNQRTKVVFTVISHYNLNVFPNLLSPVMITAEKKFCCCCCQSGPLTAVLRIPKTGYVCGENVSAVIEVDNTSNVDISKVTLKFQQAIKFVATFPLTKTKDQEMVFVEVDLGPIQQRGSKTMSYSLNIPPLPPSSLNECTIIDREYQILLRCIPVGCHQFLDASIPIGIGTIPFPAVADSSPPHYGQTTGSHVSSGAMGWTANMIPNTPAPSFNTSEFFKAKSVEAADDDEHVTYNNDLRQYSPVYPVYKYD